MSCRELITIAGLGCTVVYGGRTLDCWIVDETQNTIVTVDRYNKLRTLPKRSVTLLLNNRRLNGTKLVGTPGRRAKKGERIVVC